MKKRMRRIISAMMVCVFVVSTVEVVHAEDVEKLVSEEVKVTEENVEGVSEEVYELTEELGEKTGIESEAEDASTQEISAEAFVDGNIGYKEIINGNEFSSIPSGAVSFSTGGDYYYRTITVPARGTIYMYAQYNSSDSNGKLIFGLFEADTLKTVSAAEIDTDDGYRYFMIEVPKAGTYALGVEATAAGQAIGLRAAYFNGGDRAVASGKTIFVGQMRANTTNYFKVVPSYTGYLSAAVAGGTSQIVLCNASKNSLSGTSDGSKDVVYGVTKGKTYYIRVTMPYANTTGFYAFSVKNSKISEKSGTKKSKAVTIKKNKTIKGTIQAGSSQADWYKFKLTSKKKVIINMKGCTNSQLKIIVYKGSKKIKSFIYDNSKESLLLKSSGKWSKGTYYIKVQRANSYSSGWYSLKWK